jgi:hypothetical protein
VTFLNAPRAGSGSGSGSGHQRRAPQAPRGSTGGQRATGASQPPACVRGARVHSPNPHGLTLVTWPPSRPINQWPLRRPGKASPAVFDLFTENPPSFKICLPRRRNSEITTLLHFGRPPHTLHKPPPTARPPPPSGSYPLPKSPFLSLFPTARSCPPRRRLLRLHGAAVMSPSRISCTARSRCAPAGAPGWTSSLRKAAFRG